MVEACDPDRAHRSTDNEACSWADFTEFKDSADQPECRFSNDVALMTAHAVVTKELKKFFNPERTGPGAPRTGLLRNRDYVDFLVRLAVFSYKGEEYKKIIGRKTEEGKQSLKWKWKKIAVVMAKRFQKDRHQLVRKDADGQDVGLTTSGEHKSPLLSELRLICRRNGDGYTYRNDKAETIAMMCARLRRDEEKRQKGL